MDDLELLRGRNRHDLELPSGLWYTIGLPRIEECMAAGGVPYGLLFRVQGRIRDEIAKLRGQEVKTEAPEVTQGELQQVVVYHNELIRRSIKRVAETREALQEKPEREFTLKEVQEIPEEDWMQIKMWAGRDVEIPKAELSTSTDSPGSSPPPKDVSTPGSNGSGAETRPKASKTASSPST